MTLRCNHIAAILLLIGFSVSAQSPAIDSLKSRLAGEDSTTLRVDILNLLSDKFLVFQPVIAREYADEALKIARKLSYKSGEALALNRLGEFEFRQSNYANAIQLINQSLQIAEEQQDSTMMALCYRVLGNVNNVGLNRYDTALHYQLKAFEIHKRKHDAEKIASFCGSISWIYAATNTNLEEGHRLANWGARLADSLGHDQFLAYNYNSKGLLFQKQNELDSAIKYLDLSIKVARRANDVAVIAYNKSVKGEVLLAQNKPALALAMLNDAMMESKAVNFREILKNTYLGLSQAYHKLGNSAEAYRFHVLHGQLKDSLLNVEISQKAKLSELEFERSKQIARINQLQEENAEERREKFLIGVLWFVSLSFMVTVIILVARISKERAKSNRHLKEKNEEVALHNEILHKANETKDKIFSIIGHDLRGPMVRLQSLLQLLFSGHVSEGEFKHHLPQIKRQISGMIETLENLLHWSKGQGVRNDPENLNLRKVIDDCAALFESTAQEKNIQLQNNIDESHVVFAVSNELELVFRNLFSNAIKFTNENGIVSFDAKQTGDNIEIAIEDDGVGMTREQLLHLFTGSAKKPTKGTLGETGTGLGLSLTKEMVDLNHGKIDVTSEPGVGTKFIVTLPSGKVTAPAAS